MQWHEWIGNIGALLFLSAFFGLQKEKWKSDSMMYLGLNLVGAILILISLLVDWNLPAFLLESAWAIISIWAIAKARRGKANI